MTNNRSMAERLDFLSELGDLLRFHQQIGLDHYPFALPGLLEHGTGQTDLRRTVTSAADHQADRQKKGDIAVRSSLAVLEREINDCRRCPRGVEGAAPLTGEGKVGAALFIIVEQALVTANEERLLTDEDSTLLGKMLAAIRVSGDAVYMAPLVRCGTVEERQTKKEERTACLDLLERQIACLRPRAILIFGERAAQTLFRSEQPLFHLRGKVDEIQGIPALATYHPGQLRSEPALKQMAWQDLQILQRILAGRRN